MILLFTDRPDRFTGPANLAERIQLRTIRKLDRSPAAARALLASQQSEEPAAVLIDLGPGSPGDSTGLLELRRCFGDLVPCVLLYERDQISVADLVSYTDQGFQHFRTIDDLCAADAEAYLYRLLQEYESRQLVQGVRSFFLDQVLRDELSRTHGLLDALDSGVLILTPAFKNQDFLIHSVNDMLEILLEAELREYENRTLGDLLRAPELRESVRKALRIDGSAQGVGTRRTTLLELERGVYLERSIAPFYQSRADADSVESAQGQPAGYIVLFRDMSFDVERGLIDRVTGLVGGDQLERALLRRMRRLERYSAAPCDALGLLLVRLPGLAADSAFRASGEEAVHYVLRIAAQTLKAAVRTAGVLCRLSDNEFMIAVPGLSADRLRGLLARICDRMREVHVQAYGALDVAIGAAHCALPVDSAGLNHGVDAEELRAISRELAARRDEARMALHRAGEIGGSAAVLYTPAAGYETLQSGVQE